MNRNTSRLLFCVVIGVIVVSCSRTHEPSATEVIQQRGKLIMLCFPTLGSGVSPNLEHGATQRVGTAEDFIGLEVSLMKEFADRLGVVLEIRTLDEPGYAPLIPALLNGSGDLVASTLSITPEREEIVDFTIPYDRAYQVVVVRQDSGIQAESDLAGKVAVACRDSSHHQHLGTMGIDDNSIVFVDFVEEYYPELDEGRADYAIVDSFHPDRLDQFQNVPGMENLGVVFALPDVDNIGIAVPEGSDLKGHLDQLLTELETNGRLKEMRNEARARREELL
ncbi:MAG: amino acid ABC transporter substrate-binding protein [bacterium]|nr:amino acid ABC transporter substrate-binding protein [bacterium]